jgi:hypothetical protein
MFLEDFVHVTIIRMLALSSEEPTVFGLLQIVTYLMEKWWIRMECKILTKMGLVAKAKSVIGITLVARRHGFGNLRHVSFSTIRNGMGALSPLRV